MTSGLKELVEEARCAPLKQPCLGWYMGESDTDVTEGPGSADSRRYGEHGRGGRTD